MKIRLTSTAFCLAAPHMVDGGWMLYHGAVRFNPDTYPDPVRLFDKLHGYGWKSLLWFAYFVSPDSRLR